MTLIAPSILSADHGRLAQEIQALEAAGADWIHIDIMDGHFVPNLTFGPWVVKLARNLTKLPLDVHLMVSDPVTYGPIFAEAGADFVSVHAEAAPHLHRVLSSIKDAGAKAGVALNPLTSLSVLDYCLDMADLIVLMGVNPGFAGQTFIPLTVEKTAALALKLAVNEHKGLLEIDGGVTDKTAPALVQAGAQVLVSGSYVFKSSDYRLAMAGLRQEGSR
jgi:ribulose-phosphate 3-epimerase